MGLCQIFFKALLAGLTIQHDISDSFAVTPLRRKRTHEDLNIASFSKTPGDPAPPLKRSKTEPLLSVDKIPRASESGSKQVIRKGAPARESHTGTRLVSPARGHEKKKSTPTKIGLEP